MRVDNLQHVGVGCLHHAVPPHLPAAIGFPAAYAASKYIESFLYGMKPNDPAVLTLAVLTLLAAILLAGFVPAQRASRIDPITALRQE